VIVRRGSDSRIDLSRNELSHPDLDPILSRAITRLHGADFRRYPAVANAVAVIADRVNLDPQAMILTPGSDSALRLICQYYLSEHSSGTLLLQYPNYFAWGQSAELLGLKIERIRWSDMSTPGRELIEAARTHRRALIGISVPNGPVGGCFSNTELDELIDVVRYRGHLLVIDSCYQAFHGKWTEHLQRSHKQVLVVQSMSKSHGLAGARLGLISGHPDVMEKVAVSRLEHAVSGATLLMGCAVLESPDQFEVIWSDIQMSRRLATEQLSLKGFTVLPSGGNFLSFHLGSQELALAVQNSMAECGYQVKHLTEDDAFSDCLRITIQDRQVTQAAISQILKAIDTHWNSQAS
jgi:histidinol-phosphate aminotransferase